jgi:hypothetical protein
MDINVNIKRDKSKKEEKKPEVKTIFTLECKVDELSNTKESEEYKFSGKVKADKMDSDLMASIFANLIKQSVPEVAIEEVLNLTADKLGFTEEKCDKECCKTKDTDKFIELLHKLLGE